jgi:hypothetical protein
MHSERTNGALRDILHHINLATQFVEGFDRETFRLDLRATCSYPLFGDYIRGLTTHSRGFEGSLPNDLVEADGSSG